MARGRNTGRVLDMKEWDAIPLVQTQLSSAGTFLGGSLAFGVPATILRSRGYLQASMDATKQVGDSIDLAFGLGIISTDAFAAGGGSVPDPGDEAEYPWIWWGQMHLEAFATGGTEPWGSSSQYIEVDTKAMRKMKPGQSLAWIVQVQGASGAPVTEITLGQTRVLIGTYILRVSKDSV